MTPTAPGLGDQPFARNFFNIVDPPESRRLQQSAMRSAQLSDNTLMIRPNHPLSRYE